MRSAPPIICRHGLKIREIWWECDDCVSENGYSNEDLKKLKLDHENQKRQREYSSYIASKKKREEEKPKELVNGIKKAIGVGVLFYFLVGFGGCVVRVVTATGYPPTNSYVREAILAFFIVSAMHAYTAIKRYRD